MSLAVVRSLGTGRAAHPAGARGLRAGAGRPVLAGHGGAGVTDGTSRRSGRCCSSSSASSAARCGPRSRATPTGIWLAAAGWPGASTVPEGVGAGAVLRLPDRRYQGDIHALTGRVVVQPIDEFNRPAKPDHGIGRVPPSTAEVELLFGGVARGAARHAQVPARRSGLPGGVVVAPGRVADQRDAACSTSGTGVRIWASTASCTSGSARAAAGRGPKTRLVPAIDAVEVLLDWWLTDVRHQFGDDWDDPDAPLLPSERRDPHYRARVAAAGADALRAGLGDAVARWLPAWSGRLTPHGLRHYLRLLAVRAGHGPEGDPGAARPLVAVDHDPLHPRPRPITSSGRGPPRTTGSPPDWPERSDDRCAGTCG